MSGDEIEARFKASGTVKERSHWQVMWLLSQGRPTSEVAPIVGYSVGWVRQLAARYNGQGPQSLGDLRGGAGGSNALMDEALRAELAQVLGEPVPDALGGGLWDGVKVARWLSGRLNRPVARQRGHEALERAGYSCQSPRPRHVLADAQQQEAFKKS